MISVPQYVATGLPFSDPFSGFLGEEEAAVPTPTAAAKEEDGTAWLEEDGTVVSTE
jgi:hypothetical protein